MIERVAPEPADSASPCVNLCRIGADGLCEGCRRTLDEIGRWSSASVAERQAINAALAERHPRTPAG